MIALNQKKIPEKNYSKNLKLQNDSRLHQSLLSKLAKFNHKLVKRLLKKTLKIVENNMVRFLQNPKLESKSWFQKLLRLRPFGYHCSVLSLRETLNIVLTLSLICLLCELQVLEFLSEAFIESLLKNSVFEIELKERALGFDKLRLVFEYLLNQLLAIHKHQEVASKVIYF